MNASGFGFNGFSDPEKKTPKHDRYVNAALFSVRSSLPQLFLVFVIATTQPFVASNTECCPMQPLLLHALQYRQWVSN